MATLCYNYPNRINNGRGSAEDTAAPSSHRKGVLSMASSDHTIQIPLNNGKFSSIDAVDVDCLDFKWTLAVYKGTHSYLMRRAPRSQGGHVIFLHRVILERALGRPLNEGEFTDHINGDTLNNCRSNLRLANKAQNQMNQAKRKDNKSGVRGVCWVTGKKKWRATVAAYGKEHHLGYFDNIEDAIEARRAGEKRWHGEFSRPT